MTDYTTINIHLGGGVEGKLRKQALEQLAVEAGHVWDGEPSIGRLITALADQAGQKIGDDKMNKKIGIGDIVAWTSGHPGRSQKTGHVGVVVLAEEDHLIVADGARDVKNADENPNQYEYRKVRRDAVGILQKWLVDSTIEANII